MRFGYETKDTVQVVSANQIMGSWFTSYVAGQARSIGLYLTQNAANTPKLKCAIYRKSDNALIGSTEEWTLTEGFDGVKNFDITSGGVIELTDYIIVIWAEAAVNIYKTDESGKGRLQGIAYNSWPDPLAAIPLNIKVAIWAEVDSLYANITQKILDLLEADAMLADKVAAFYFGEHNLTSPTTRFPFIDVKWRGGPVSQLKTGTLITRRQMDYVIRCVSRNVNEEEAEKDVMDLSARVETVLDANETLGALVETSTITEVLSDSMAIGGYSIVGSQLRFKTKT